MLDGFLSLSLTADVYKMPPLFPLFIYKFRGGLEYTQHPSARDDERPRTWGKY